MGHPSEPVVDAALALDTGATSGGTRCVNRAAGRQETIRRAILPAMREIGARWKAGRCDVGREHFATEGVRAWLARQAFLAPPPSRPHPIVLACGPQDLHTIGLESFAVILARRGWPCRVLGARTPTEALVSTVKAMEAIGAVVTAQRSVTRRSAAEAITAAAALPGVELYVAMPSSRHRPEETSPAYTSARTSTAGTCRRTSDARGLRALHSGPRAVAT